MSYVDLAVGLGFFLFFLSLVLIIAIQQFVEIPTELTIEEFRERAVVLFEEFFSTMGVPGDWEDSGAAPSELGLATTVYRIPVTIKETNSTNRVNEPVAVNLDFDDDCTNKAWNNTIRVYDENLNEIPYQLSHENFCTSQFLKNSTVTFEINISANQEKESYVWYSPDDSITGPNYALSIKGYWKFDDGSGSNTALDDSGNSNIGTLTNMNIQGNATSGWTTDCKYGSCLKFDGVNDYVNCGSSLSLFPSHVTFEAWVYPTTAVSGDYVIKNDVSYFVVLVGDGTQLSVQVNLFIDGVWRGRWVATQKINKNEWSHIAFTYDGTEITIYVNGIPSGPWTPSPTGDLTTSGLFHIGRRGSGNYFNGTIDRVRIWDRALSPTEINATYSFPLVVKKFPEEEETVISQKKIDALNNLTYSELRDVTGQDYQFRIEIVAE